MFMSGTIQRQSVSHHTLQTANAYSILLAVIPRCGHSVDTDTLIFEQYAARPDMNLH